MVQTGRRHCRPKEESNLLANHVPLFASRFGGAGATWSQAEARRADGAYSHWQPLAATGCQAQTRAVMHHTAALDSGVKKARTNTRLVLFLPPITL